MQFPLVVRIRRISIRFGTCLRWITALLLTSLFGLAAPARADGWTASDVQLEASTKWQWSAGSGGSETRTTNYAEIEGQSASASEGNPNTSAQLDRTYRRVYTKVGNPQDLQVTITLTALAVADTGSGTETGEAVGQALVSSQTGDFGGKTVPAEVAQSAGGLEDPPLVKDPANGVPRSDSASGTLAFTTTLKCRLKVDTTASTQGVSTNAFSQGTSRGSFSDPPQ